MRPPSMHADSGPWASVLKDAPNVGPCPVEEVQGTAIRILVRKLLSAAPPVSSPS